MKPNHKVRCQRRLAVTAYTKRIIREKLIDHKSYVCKYGQDIA